MHNGIYFDDYNLNIEQKQYKFNKNHLINIIREDYLSFCFTGYTTNGLNFLV